MAAVTIYTHGATKTNPGLAAVAVQAVDQSGKQLLEQAMVIGNATPDTAAFAAVAFGLEVAAEQFGDELQKYDFVLSLTNQALKEQLNGERVVHDPGIVPYFMQIYNLRVEHFPEMTVEYMSDGNSALEQMVKAALDGNTAVA